REARQAAGDERLHAHRQRLDTDHGGGVGHGEHASTVGPAPLPRAGSRVARPRALGPCPAAGARPAGNAPLWRSRAGAANAVLALPSASYVRAAPVRTGPEGRGTAPEVEPHDAPLAPRPAARRPAPRPRPRRGLRAADPTAVGGRPLQARRPGGARDVRG